MDYAKRVEELLKMPQSLCNKCGLCCKVSTFKGGLSYDEIKKLSRDESNPDLKAGASKYLELFIPVSYEKAYQDSTDYVNTLKSGLPPYKKPAFFKCKYINNDTNLCNIYDKRPPECRNYPVPHESTIYHSKCGYKEQGKKNWQEIQVIIQKLHKTQKELEHAKKKELKEHLKETKWPTKYNPPPPGHLCKGCGICCRLAVNKSTFFELIDMSNKGHPGAKEFLRIFEPIPTFKEAEKICALHYKNIIENHRKKHGDLEDLTFYHCKYIDENNLCGNYENRPSVCKEHPALAWGTLYEYCGYTGWVFEIKEKQKQFVRMLKQYLYIKESLAENGVAKNVAVEELKNLDIDLMPDWKPFIDFSPLMNTIYPEDKSLPVEDISVKDLEEIIKKKAEYWMDLYYIT